MVIKILSSIPIAKVTGPEMDKSGLVTILAELPLAPSALGSKRLSWEPIDASSACATLRYKGVKVSGVFYFDDDGRIVRFETEDRFREVDNKPVRTPWVVHYRRYEEIDGWEVPVEFDAAWRFDDCELSYAQFRATHIEFNANAGG
jgi:hypothetical protein